LEAAINLSRANLKPLHVCHVSTKEEILAIAEAKEEGLPVTCEVTPHHLFMTEKDASTLGPYGYMKPELKTARNVAALWDNLDYIDILATDHAPHTKEEKDSPNPPPGIPSIEYGALLMLTAVQEGRLSIEKFIDMTETRPKQIFSIPMMPESYAIVEMDTSWHVGDLPYQTKVNWSPYEGASLRAQVREVYVAGQQVLKDGEFTAPTSRKELMIR
jgi:carbamoyl-phosphate synthase/aspartate carbamoyltransferase/dihydroorotase